MGVLDPLSIPLTFSGPHPVLPVCIHGHVRA